SEDYSYKTDAYYTILRMEMEGKRVQPSSSAVIDAFVVPICLERAKIAGIPVCTWEISQAYVPLPSILYGINYFATASEFVAVYDNEAAKEAVRHITNKGKYPFCYQELGDGAEIIPCNVIFGKTICPSLPIVEMALWVYDLFAIPLMQMVLVRTGNTYSLSSIASVRYSQLLESERSLLEAHISHQEFL
ncbi:MAG: RimK-like ATPgrasp N-terminal domain-containing protein, partial [Methanoregula sp.]|nr:RimK-like ATPgrasp N-terminal domain-containing protein [Methanoregula sp.]